MVSLEKNQRPDGLDTSGVPRPVLGEVLVSGAGIYDCQNPGDIALTFDDGPYIYTSDLLDKFAVSNPDRPAVSLYGFS